MTLLTKRIAHYMIPTLAFTCQATYSMASEDYTWEVTGYIVTRRPTPEEACQSFWTDVMLSPGDLSDFEYLGAGSILGGAALCHYSLKNDRNNPESRLIFNLAMRRLGSNCAVGAVYNDDTGECEVTPITVGDICSDQTDSKGGALLLIQSNGACLPISKSANQKGRPKPLSCVGNPIDLTTGNKFQQETDFSIAGQKEAEFSRAYNSIDGVWRHNYSARIRDNGNVITVIKPDGGEEYFIENSSISLTAKNSRSQIIKSIDGYDYRQPSGNNFKFDQAGILVEETTSNGTSITIKHTGNEITITSNTGRSFTFTEDLRHQPTSLTSTAVKINYTYDSYNRLISLAKTEGKSTETRDFTYSANPIYAKLTGIIDERKIQFSSWTYDDSGRANSSQHANNTEKTTLTFNKNGSTTVTNALGKQTTYQFQTIQGTNLITAIQGEPSLNCAASNSVYTYNDSGQVLTKTDAQGFITTYTYNDRGLETSRTEASGTPLARITTTEWDPVRFLPTKVVTPTQTTLYTYDDQGRQLSQQTTMTSTN